MVKAMGSWLRPNCPLAGTKPTHGAPAHRSAECNADAVIRILHDGEEGYEDHVKGAGIDAPSSPARASGTSCFEVELGALDEIQQGSYVSWMGTTRATSGSRRCRRFEHSMFVLAA